MTFLFGTHRLSHGLFALAATMPDLQFSSLDAQSILSFLQKPSPLLPPELLPIKIRLEADLQASNASSALPTPSLPPSLASSARASIGKDFRGPVGEDSFRDPAFFPEFQDAHLRDIREAQLWDDFQQDEELNSLSTVSPSRASCQQSGDKEPLGEVDQLILELLEESGLTDKFDLVSNLGLNS